MSGPDDRLDYFAAHAPNEIPDWFPHDDSDLPRVVTAPAALAADERYRALGDVDQTRLLDWMADGCYDLDTPQEEAIVQTALDLIAESRERFEVEGDRRERARFFAWRWAFADGMAAARPAGIRP